MTLTAGVQIAYLDATFKFGSARRASTLFYRDDYGFGWTVGAMIQLATGTKVGIGFRSPVNYDLQGVLAGNSNGNGISADAQLTTPNILTVSLRQKLLTVHG